jgi:hypothetical protein
MARVLRLLAIGGVLLLAMVLVQQIAAESGEVVVLTTQDAKGAAYTTRLWVVDHRGAQYLRAGSPQATWYQQLLAMPAVTLRRSDGKRGDVERSYRAFPELLSVPEINDLMSNKYGWADSYIGFLFGRQNSVPIRLDGSAN